MDPEWLLHSAQGCLKLVRSLFTVGKNALLKQSQVGWRITISVVQGRSIQGQRLFMILDVQKQAHLIFDVFVLLL